MNLITKCKYIEITYLENKDATVENTICLRLSTIRESLAKFNLKAPNRIITNIDFLFIAREQ